MDDFYAFIRDVGKNVIEPLQGKKLTTARKPFQTELKKLMGGRIFQQMLRLNPSDKQSTRFIIDEVKKKILSKISAVERSSMIA